jgi:hypothetical protein
MTTLTLAAVMALANTCVGPSLAPVMVGIAQHESGLNPDAVNHNPNGTSDVGLAQVNSANFGWLGLTKQTAMDPCANLRAGARVLLAKYNGSGPATIAYASSVTARIRALDGSVLVNATSPSPPPPCAPAWDAWALAACSKPSGTQTTIAQETTKHAN